VPAEVPHVADPQTPALPAPLERPRRLPLIGLLLGISFGFNLLALWLPFVQIDAAGSAPWVYGLFGSVMMLWDAGMVALALLVFTFSVIFPFAKLTVLGWLWWQGVNSAGRHRVLMLVEKLGKWSLFDVFLVSIMVALTNDQWLISSDSLPGLTCFLIAVLVGMLAGEVLNATTPVPATASLPSADPESAPRTSMAYQMILLALVVLIAVLLAYTLSKPFIEIDDLRLADREFSLVSLVPALWQNQSAILALALGMFVIAIPVVRWLMTAGMVLVWWRKAPSPRALSLSHVVGRWSMLSVFAMSMGVFLAEGYRFLETKPSAAVWTLAGGLMLTWIAQGLLARLWSRR
jgi:uncharacterized paraquat-inducible protein A